jgi:hypothetical protein
MSGWHPGCFEEPQDRGNPRDPHQPGGDTMKKLSIVKLEKRIAPRYVPF